MRRMLKLKRKIGSKGQVVIPKPIREELGIHTGEEVYFYVQEDKVILEKKSGEAFLEEFLNAVKEKQEEPAKIDWDQRYYGEFKSPSHPE